MQFPKINNKRADFSVVLFVLLVLLLCGYSLYVIISQENKAQQKILGYESAEELLLEKKGLEYRMTKLGEECVVSSFGPKMTYFDYEKWVEERSGENFISLIKACLKEKSNSLAKEIGREKFMKLHGAYSRIGGEVKLELESNQEYLSIKLKEFNITESNSQTTYVLDLNAKVYWNRIGLIPPEKFKELIECKNDCYIEKITKNLFDIEIKKEKDHKVYNFTSKKEFLIDNKFKKIEVGFHVPEKKTT